MWRTKLAQYLAPALSCGESWEQAARGCRVRHSVFARFWSRSQPARPWKVHALWRNQSFEVFVFPNNRHWGAIFASARVTFVEPPRDDVPDPHLLVGFMPQDNRSAFLCGVGLHGGTISPGMRYCKFQLPSLKAKKSQNLGACFCRCLTA